MDFSAVPMNDSSFQELLTILTSGIGLWLIDRPWNENGINKGSNSQALPAYVLCYLRPVGSYLFFIRNNHWPGGCTDYWWHGHFLSEISRMILELPPNLLL